MSFISFGFAVMVAVVLAIYYLLPVRYRWLALLAGSLWFYLSGGKRATVVILGLALFSFYMAKVLEGMDPSKSKKRRILLAVAVLVFVLAAFKLCAYFHIFSGYLIVPLGISYVTLSMIGYLLDVYWKKDKADENVGHFLTFIFFFPKIVQGPISRHRFLHKQLIPGNRFQYERFCYGMQLIVWGLFKKILLADRMNLLVSNVYGNLDVYASHGLIIALTMVLSALQLYCDFSGYTDMAIGIAQMFGIQLERNFNHPFFAKSAAEFWQRWHISLSSWFKDYLFLPVSRTEVVKRLSKRMGSKFGPMARKRTMMVISTSVVWLATGLWHGTGINYLVWGFYWGFLIIFSEIFSAQFQKLNSILHINTAAPTWAVFRMLRTAGIFVFGKMISAQNTLHDVKVILNSLIKNIHLSDLGLLPDLGLAKVDFLILAIGLLTLFAVSCMQERGIEIRKEIAGWNAVPRWIFYTFSVTVVLLIGLYGDGYDTSTFAYQFF